jgi:hypothetical protein
LERRQGVLSVYVVDYGVGNLTMAAFLMKLARQEIEEGLEDREEATAQGAEALLLQYLRLPNAASSEGLGDSWVA